MAESERLRLAIIIGSIRKGRFGHVAAEWLAARARLRHDFDVDVIDLATAWLPDVMSADPLAPKPQAVKDLAPWLGAADAFVVVTPEHNQTFPASLKNAIDWYDEEWHAKPVAFLSYGGPSSGLCAVAGLRQVFSLVHAVPVSETVSFHNYWERLGPDGNLVAFDEWETSARVMFDRISWWAGVLHRARTESGYQPPQVNRQERSAPWTASGSDDSAIPSRALSD
ncbi:NADPH-dependent FMN reductase [Streptomyces turgidiscabies]|uniref:Flavin reductase n=1 Tax=Streptomyces turgidiscabies (strain Car8) TaxID=698760 RepID=L7FCB2_STRT8|nr:MULTISPECIES: NAD(P)H-dependent oxidoreductase [Streptomyces]ELP68671.1 flavin reductase [Streptomyces turgidiscabies Car8]MDX3498445.1 NAD(P)H-dependent oxidoreductase [Streptomyces turgidiscabies]GAQ74592.1 FMN-dependent NADPH-azoreductase [Streptomyces turgidiscabies]